MRIRKKETKLTESITAGYQEGQNIARLAGVILVVLGIMEVIVGTLSKSTSVTADGIDSFSDAAIAFIVWSGLRLSLREPSRYFHYGYFKVESLVSFTTSIGLVGVASFVAFRGYLAFLQPHKIVFPVYALIALVIAGSVSLYYSIRMRRIAKKHNLVSLQIGAANSIKDASASFVVLASVILAALGFIWMDAIGAIIVAAYIYSIAYVAIKESSFVLLDSFNSPEVVDRVRSIVRAIGGVSDVTEIKLRRNGPFLSGRVKILVNSDMPIREADKIAEKVQSTLNKEIGTLKEFVVLIGPDVR